MSEMEQECMRLWQDVKDLLERDREEAIRGLGGDILSAYRDAVGRYEAFADDLHRDFFRYTENHMQRSS